MERGKFPVFPQLGHTLHAVIWILYLGSIKSGSLLEYSSGADAVYAMPQSTMKWVMESIYILWVDDEDKILIRKSSRLVKQIESRTMESGKKDLYPKIGKSRMTRNQKIIVLVLCRGIATNSVRTVLCTVLSLYFSCNEGIGPSMSKVNLPSGSGQKLEAAKY
jgi:hypothetical protein